MSELWDEHSGINNPRTKNDFEIGMDRLLKSGAITFYGKSPADRKKIINELWSLSQCNIPVLISSAEAAIKAHAGDHYMAEVIRSGLQEIKPKKTNGRIHHEEEQPPIPTTPPPEIELDYPEIQQPEPPRESTDSDEKESNQVDEIPNRFTVPPDIRPHHIPALTQRVITESFAMRSGVRSIADNEALNLGFATVITHDQRTKGMQGTLFAYCDPGTRQERTFRLKPDQQFQVGGESAKYLSRKSDPIQAYFPHTTTQEMLQNIKYQILITEGEFKTLSLAENIVPIASRPTCVVGLQGVNGGWHRDKIVITHADGTKENKKEGHPHLIDDLEAIQWKGRVVYIIFDSDVGTKKHAEEFKKSKRSGAIGAEYTLAMLLKAKGAEVRIVVIPHDPGNDKLGADDYCYLHGKYALLKLIYNNWVVDRNIDDILYRGEGCTISFETAADLVASSPEKPDFVIDGLLPVGGTAMLAGSPGIGKSFLALGLGFSVATGMDFLGLRTKQGAVVYIQSEIPRWAMAERIRSFDCIPDDLIIYSPTDLKLNLWEPDGFNKRRDTGSREKVESLTMAIRDRGASLVIIDPLIHFHTLPENDPDSIRHLFQIFRGIARVANCGILIVHHHRKIGARKEKYEGAEDMRGSIALFAEPDSVLSMYSHKTSEETSRLKLVYSKLRHCEPKDSVELIRSSGTTLVWSAEKWEEEMISTYGREDSIVDVLTSSESGMSPKEIMHQANIPSATFYRLINKLMKQKKITKIGSCYYLPRNDE